MKLNESDIKKIEQFMDDECYSDVEMMIKSIKRIVNFAKQQKYAIDRLDSLGDLD